MKYVSAKYEGQLADLAEVLMQNKRQQLSQLTGQTALAEVIELHPVIEDNPIPA